MGVEYVEKTKTLIGTKRKELIDKETGEIIEVDQITKKVYGQKNFWKLYLGDFLPVLGIVESKQVDILILLHQKLLRQSKMVEKAEKYEREREKILADNKNLHNEVEQIKSEYKEKEFDIEWKYKIKIKSLEKENNYLKKVVDRFKENIDNALMQEPDHGLFSSKGLKQALKSGIRKLAVKAGILPNEHTQETEIVE